MLKSIPAAQSPGAQAGPCTLFYRGLKEGGCSEHDLQAQAWLAVCWGAKHSPQQALGSCGPYCSPTSSAPRLSHLRTCAHHWAGFGDSSNVKCWVDSWSSGWPLGTSQTPSSLLQFNILTSLVIGVMSPVVRVTGPAAAAPGCLVHLAVATALSL